jgi:hypothetical protein
VSAARDVLEPVRQFIEAMEAVRDLQRFAGKHGDSIDNENVAIISAAARHFPQVTLGQHERVMDIMLDMRRDFEDMAGALDGNPLEEEDGVLTQHARAVFERRGKEAEEVAGDSSIFLYYLSAIGAAQDRLQRLPVLRSSLLTTAVSQFEVLVGHLVKFFFEAKPQALRSLGQQYSMQDVDQFESIDEFRSYAIDQHVESLLRGGYIDWLKWFDRHLKVSSSHISSQSDAVVEIFQRRHLFVHNGGVVNRSYLSKVSPDVVTAAMGEALVVDDSYLDGAVDRLTSAGLILGARVIAQLTPVVDDSHPVEKILIDESYKHLLAERWEVPIELSNQYGGHAKADSCRLFLRVNNWVGRKMSTPSGVESIRSEVELWQVASLDGQFRLAKLALLDECEAASRLGDRLMREGKIKPRDWQVWPLLASVREWEARHRPRQGQLSLSVDVETRRAGDVTD